MPPGDRRHRRVQAVPGSGGYVRFEMKKAYVKPGREKPVRGGHPWIFSGALSRVDEGIADGDVVAVCDASGKVLARGHYNASSQIRVRVLSTGNAPWDDAALAGALRRACALRESDPTLAGTDAYRLVNSEGDFLPGLVVDRYGHHLVLQALSLGMDRIKSSVAETLAAASGAASVYERSDHPGRAAESLGPCSGQLRGETPDEIVIAEDGMRFAVDVKAGQKTGFFLDQRENRRLVRGYARGRKVLNMYCYTGGFTVSALAGGARAAVSVDSSAPAIAAAERNAALNGCGGVVEFVVSDAARYLREAEILSDFIILDPPAFAKSRDAVDSACRGYKDINLHAIRRCPPGSLVLTCSCSRFVDMDLFRKVVFGAAADAGRRVRVLSAALHAPDHPVSLSHPEGIYLKSLLLSVE